MVVKHGGECGERHCSSMFFHFFNKNSINTCLKYICFLYFSETVAIFFLEPAVFTNLNKYGEG